MVTAVESDGSRTRFYHVPGEPGTWRVYRDTCCLGRVRRVGETFAAIPPGGVPVDMGYRSRSAAASVLIARAGGQR